MISCNIFKYDIDIVYYQYRYTILPVATVLDLLETGSRPPLTWMLGGLSK